MILVTGATGFLGSELVKQLLDKGYSVRALKRSSSNIPAILQNQTAIEWVDADLLDFFSLEACFDNITQVYHCAALVSFDPAYKKQLLRVNQESTANIVNLCLDKGIEKLVHVSSVAALGIAKGDKCISEESKWEFDGTQNGYSISKFESEMEVWRGISEGLNAVIVNPSLIIGKNAGTKGTGQLFELVRKGLKFYTSGDVGLVDVEDVAQLMIRLMESPITAERFILNAENPTDNFLFFVEHPHVYTLGKSGKPDHLLLDEEGLKEKSASYYKINRGGDITYHGPGQIVGYPILDLENFFTDIHLYLRTLEEAIIQTLAHYGIQAGRYEGYTGVWLDADNEKARKICAMGVRCSRWVTMHGFAFNVNANLEYFKNIVPCGIDDKDVTSMQRELGQPVDINEVKEVLKTKIGDLFEMLFV